MSTAPYILARTFAEAHSYARDDLGLDPGYYRVVNSSGTLKAVRGVTLYLVPGWRNRFDRFAMQSALRWTRMNVIDVAEQLAQEPAAEPDDLEPAGFQLTLVGLDEAHDFITGVINVDTPADEPVEAPQEQAPEPEAPKKNRRRRRCNDCGTLHFKEDPCIPSESV